MRSWLVVLPLLLSTTACFNPSDAVEEADTGTGADESGAETTAGTPSCAEYCGLVEDHCDGEAEQYSGTAICESTCALIPPGTEADQLGNTVGCRIYHTILAAEQPEPHCRHAGPSGDGTCGASCENFCSIALAACTGENAVWPNAEACLADCVTFNPDPPYTSTTPDADTFSCRMFHATLASLGPVPHCEHIGPDSPVCQ